MPPLADAARLLRGLACLLLAAGVFALAYCQAPLYYSNQNQYFLHGLADAGVGLLREDWLARTHDPTPAFSALVAFTVRHLHPWAFYFFYALLMGVYALAMLGLFRSLAGEAVAQRRWPAFFALFLAAHAALVRWASYRWLGNDYPWFLQAGVAGQYVLGAMFQPSVFGVLLVAAVCLFVRGRPFPAVACACLAATVHPTYLLCAALLTLGFLAALLVEGKPLRALALGAFALALVLPVSLRVLFTFGPTSGQELVKAQDILVNVRIPHHARPDRWLDPVAVLQIGWVVLALALVRRTPLLPVLGVPFLLGAALTLAQVATGSNTLALLFPWRISAVLVPLATTVVLSRLVALPGLPLGGVPAPALSGAVVVVLMAGGLWISAQRLAFHSDTEDAEVIDFVRQNKKPGDVYFIPVSVPDLVKNTRGSLSSDFKPLPDKRRDLRVIPVDMQGFRLQTGAPVFVDFKSIPYKDADVLAWYARLREAKKVQAWLRAGNLPAAVAELRRLGVTHLIVHATIPLHGEGLTRVYEDDYYLVYRLEATTGG
jgi:hypothetical protein